ncbi:MAG: hypothetical protein AAGB00_01350 [Planctomycetota bacterium]
MRTLPISADRVTASRPTLAFATIPLAGALAFSLTAFSPAFSIAESGPPRQPAGAEARHTAPDTWAGSLPSKSPMPMRLQCGPTRQDKYVAMFYFVWHGAHSKSGPHDVSLITAGGPEGPDWGPPRAFHHWGEPELGYYLSTDTYVYRRHATMLSDAGVDVAVIDVTNGAIYEQQVNTLCRTWMAMRREGNRTPQIAFLTNSSSASVVQRLYERFYQTKKFPDLWFPWRGKPLMLAKREGIPQATADFFTLRQSWAWSKSAWFGDGRLKWCWIDDYPQKFGWRVAGEAEQVSVSVAGHPTRNIGRSNRRGQQPSARKTRPDRGLYFREQFKHARRLDPELIFVTGWNEWVAQRFVHGETKSHGKKFLGRKLEPGDTYFVDQYDQEFSRDIEPMRGGHGDNYYKQLVAEVRRFKGVGRVPDANGPHAIVVDGAFSDWAPVTPEYRDEVGDTAHRSHPGWGSTGSLADATGRNDFVSTRVAYDAQNVYFMAKTRGPIRPDRSGAWLMLLVDADQNRRTGWLGYDFVIARQPGQGDAHTLYALDEVDGRRRTRRLGRAPSALAGNQLELAVPRAQLAAGEPLAFDFHWYDSNEPLTSEEDLKERGDSAPNRDFNYRYLGADE